MSARRRGKANSFDILRLDTFASPLEPTTIPILASSSAPILNTLSLENRQEERNPPKTLRSRLANFLDRVFTPNFTLGSAERAVPTNVANLTKYKNTKTNKGDKIRRKKLYKDIRTVRFSPQRGNISPGIYVTAEDNQRVLFRNSVSAGWEEGSVVWEPTPSPCSTISTRPTSDSSINRSVVVNHGEEEEFLIRESVSRGHGMTADDLVSSSKHSNQIHAKDETNRSVNVVDLSFAKLSALFRPRIHPVRPVTQQKNTKPVAPVITYQTVEGKSLKARYTMSKWDSLSEVSIYSTGHGSSMRSWLEDDPLAEIFPREACPRIRTAMTTTPNTGSKVQEKEDNRPWTSVEEMTNRIERINTSVAKVTVHAKRVSKEGINKSADVNVWWKSDIDNSMDMSLIKHFQEENLGKEEVTGNKVDRSTSPMSFYKSTRGFSTTKRSKVLRTLLCSIRLQVASFTTSV